MMESILQPFHYQFAISFIYFHLNRNCTVVKKVCFCSGKGQITFLLYKRPSDLKYRIFASTYSAQVENTLCNTPISNNLNRQKLFAPFRKETYFSTTVLIGALYWHCIRFMTVPNILHSEAN